MDPDRHEPNTANMTHTCHWLYAQFEKGFFKKVWHVIVPVLPYEDNFKAPERNERESLSRFYARTITALLIMKVAPVAALERKSNPNIQWSKRGSG